MIVTEEEAKTKRCQEGFGVKVPSLDGYAGQPSPHMCIGSACMAWRWYDLKIGHISSEDYRRENPPDGYCGKAGRP